MGANLPSVGDTVNHLLRGLGSEEFSFERLATELTSALQRREDDRQQAYRERDALLAALTLFLPAHLAAHADDEWRTIVCMHVDDPRPRQDALGDWHVEHTTHTLTWHIHASEVPRFSHLEWRVNDWDGSDTAETYRRLAALSDASQERQRVDGWEQDGEVR